MKKDEYSSVAINYKKRVTNSFISITASDIEARIAGKRFFVSRKYDGQLALLFFDGKSISAFNSSGKPISELPVFASAAEALKAAKIKEAVIAAELYVDEKKGRTRVSDVSKAIADKKLQNSLRLAPFDITELNGKPYKADNWGETWKELNSIFAKQAECLPVAMKEAVSTNEVMSIFSQWVEKEGAEGIVVRSELPLVYKVKPLFTIDAAVIGFTESETKGRIRNLLFALMNADGTFQVIAHSGNGLDEDARTKLFTELSKKTVPSTFIRTDSRHVAFRMVKPEKAAEISAIDIVGEGGDGPVTNPILVLEKDGYHSVGTAPGVSLLSASFVQWRKDKSVNKDDVRSAQIADFIGEAKTKAGKLDKSKMLRREVYTKESGGKIMVQKFLLWKTNKEKDNPEYPAFVFSYVNFSSGRADAFQSEVRITNDEKQAGGIFDSYITDNVKKGWEKK